MGNIRTKSPVSSANKLLQGEKKKEEREKEKSQIKRDFRGISYSDSEVLKLNFLNLKLKTMAWIKSGVSIHFSLKTVDM